MEEFWMPIPPRSIIDAFILERQRQGRIASHSRHPMPGDVPGNVRSFWPRSMLAESKSPIYMHHSETMRHSQPGVL